MFSDSPSAATSASAVPSMVASPSVSKAAISMSLVEILDGVLHKLGTNSDKGRVLGCVGSQSSGKTTPTPTRGDWTRGAGAIEHGRSPQWAQSVR